MKHNKDQPTLNFNCVAHNLFEEVFADLEARIVAPGNAKGCYKEVLIEVSFGHILFSRQYFNLPPLMSQRLAALICGKDSEIATRFNFARIMSIVFKGSFAEQFNLCFRL